MTKWDIQIDKKPKLTNPILIEGLPGIGNVGKVTVDFMIDELKAIKIGEFFSSSLPNSVFVNDDNLVELPTIELFYKKSKSADLLLLAGDVQPIDEESCYDFCFAILDLVKSMGCKEIITLGGIGLPQVPKKPKVYITGTSKSIIKKYKKGTQLSDKLYGVVGPIVGVSGLLVGLAPKKKINAVSMLAETFGHPMYLGVKGSREILKVLKAQFKLKIELKELDKEISNIESEIMKRSDELFNVSRQSALKKFKKYGESSYIG